MHTVIGEEPPHRVIAGFKAGIQDKISCFSDFPTFSYGERCGACSDILFVKAGDGDRGGFMEMDSLDGPILDGCLDLIEELPRPLPGDDQPNAILFDQAVFFCGLGIVFLL